MIKDPHWIYPGQVFVIPGLDTTVTVVERPAGEEPKAVEPEPEPEEEDIALAPTEEPEKKPEPKLPAAKPAADPFEALSTDFPKGLVGQQTSMPRSRKPLDWRADGEVLEYRGRESIAGNGDYVQIRMAAPQDLRKGQPLTVYRKAGPTEADQDKNGRVIPGTYLGKVGVVEVERKFSAQDYRATVLRAAGAVQAGDVLRIGEE